MKTKRVILTFLIIFGSVSLFAQDYAKIQKAFADSYSLEKKGEYTDAIKKMKAVYNADSYEINLRLGWLNYQSGNFTESISHYSKALNIMPYSEEAKYGLIYPKAAIGKWGEVIALYEQILKSSPNNTLANYRLGLIRYGKKEYTKAYANFKIVVDLYPFDYDGLLMYAWTNLQMGKYREAKILFNKILMLSPDDKSALEGLGLIK